MSAVISCPYPLEFCVLEKKRKCQVLRSFKIVFAGFTQGIMTLLHLVNIQKKARENQENHLCLLLSYTCARTHARTRTDQPQLAVALPAGSEAV